MPLSRSGRLAKALGLLGAAWLILGIGSCATLDEGPTDKTPGVRVDTGTLADREATWRGMVLGGPFSAPVKGRVPDIRRRAVQEALEKKLPMVYLTTDGLLRLEILTWEEAEGSKCLLIRERIFQKGQLVREEVNRHCP